MSEGVSETTNSNDIPTIKTFLDIRSTMIAIVGLFVAGIFSTIAVTSYLDDRANEKYLDKSKGLVTAQRVTSMEEVLKQQTARMEVLQQQQNQLLIVIGEISGKLDTLTKK